MTNVSQGASLTLISQWFEYAAGPPADLLTTPTVRVIRLSDNANVVPPTSVGVNHPTTGVYTYSWQVLAEAVTGDHLVVWNGTDAASGAVSANEVVTVVSAGLVETWCTPTEASNITGQSLTQSQLNVAYHVIELYAGVIVAARAALTARDHRLLKKAEAYQAAWMAGQIGLMDRSDADLVSQDGLQYSKGDQDMHILGPLAKKALMKLSWARTRTWDPLTPEQALILRNKVTAETYGMSDQEDLDDDLAEDWRPI